MDLNLDKLVNEVILKTINKEEFDIEKMVKSLTEQEKTEFYLKLKRQVAYLQMQNSPNMSGSCHDCIHKRKYRTKLHVGCNCLTAQAFGDEYGIKQGWFNWPIEFDPFLLNFCDSFVAEN